MALFSNPRKELDEALQHILINTAGHGGSIDGGTLSRLRGEAAVMVNRMVAKGKATDARAVIEAAARKTPSPSVFFRASSQADVDAASLAAHAKENDPADAAAWKAICDELLALLPS